MHAVQILHQHLRRCCRGIHVKRLSILLACVVAALRGQRITLSELGRALPRDARVKHSIKSVDRLLGNRHLASECFGIYQAIARWLLAATQQPVIIVDWSDLTANRHWQLLRAAVPMGGRTLTVYEEVHPLRDFSNARVHRAFLQRLQVLVPACATPIVISDAGFRVPWFKAVSRLGWHWIGRVRGRDRVRAHGASIWIACTSLHTQARQRPQALGSYQLVRSNPIECHLYLVQRRKKHRVNKSVFGERLRTKHSLKQARAQREPWLLAASPSLAAFPALHIVNIYAQRMQIEEGFRDLKCERYGLGFELNLSRGRQRLAALLLIASLALFVLWRIGSAAHARGLHLQHQSNTRTTRPVLSVLSLARHVLNRDIYNSPPRTSSWYLCSPTPNTLPPYRL